jgi:hypothetical protein
MAKITIIRSGVRNIIARRRREVLPGLTGLGCSVGAGGSKDETFSGKSGGKFSIFCF